MTAGHADIHGRVLDHLLDGVMVVERGGAITVFNPAAARILGVSAGEVAGGTFTELFITREGFEELSEFILDAVAGEGAGRQVVTGNAFPDLRMRGTVTHVSSQPLAKTRGATRFEVEVTLEADQRERLRAGMSSTLQVAVYSNDAALMVPIEAVDRSGPSHLVRLVNRETREVQEHAVQVGTTTLDSVEITAGLQPGDEIVVRSE